MLENTQDGSEDRSSATESMHSDQPTSEQAPLQPSSTDSLPSIDLPRPPSNHSASLPRPPSTHSAGHPLQDIEQPSTSSSADLARSASATPDQMAQQHTQHNIMDIATIAQLLLGDGAKNLSDVERSLLEKALNEQVAVEAAMAGRISEAELLKQHNEAAVLLQKQSQEQKAVALLQKQNREQKAKEQQAMMAAQREALLQAKMQQDTLVKIQQEILAAHKDKENKERLEKAKLQSR